MLGGLRTLWLIIGITLVSAAVIEGSLRVVRHWKRLGNVDEMASRAAFRNEEWVHDYIVELESVGNTWCPYVHWRAAPFAGRYINIGDDQLRRTAQAARSKMTAVEDKPPAKLTIWMFGGSVVWGWGARDEHTIPSELARELAETGHDVEVVNYGQIGYVSTQDVLTLYGALRRGGRPDVVVFFSGYNDLMAALQERVAGLPQNEHNRRTEFNARLSGALAAETRNSATMWLIRGLLRRAGLDKVDARQRYGGPGQPTIDELGQDVLHSYAENVRLVEQMAPAFGFKVLYYWQPAAFWKKKTVGDERNAADGWPAMKELLAVVRQSLSTTPTLSEGATFRDLTGFFDDSPEPIFLDCAHFSEGSNRLVAREIAKDVAPILKARAEASAP